jgi:hypothetical protein
MGRSNRSAQGGLGLVVQQGALPVRAVASVSEGFRTSCVVATSDLADPVRRVAREAGNGFGGETARQELEEVPVTALDRIGRAPIASREFVSAQMRFEGDASCQVSLSTPLQRDSVGYIL